MSCLFGTYTSIKESHGYAKDSGGVRITVWVSYNPNNCYYWSCCPLCASIARINCATQSVSRSGVGSDSIVPPSVVRGSIYLFLLDATPVDAYGDFIFYMFSKTLWEVLYMRYYTPSTLY